MTDREDRATMLAAYVLGELTEDQAGVVEVQLRTDPALAREVEELRAALAAVDELRPDELDEITAEPAALPASARDRIVRTVVEDHERRSPSEPRPANVISISSANEIDEPAWGPSHIAGGDAEAARARRAGDGGPSASTSRAPGPQQTRSDATAAGTRRGASADVRPSDTAGADADQDAAGERSRSRVRRSPGRWAWIAIPVAVALVAVVVVINVLAGSPADPGLGVGEPIAVEVESDELTVEASVVPRTWGTEVVLTMAGLVDGTIYRVDLEDRNGASTSAGSFTGDGAREVVAVLTGAVLREDLRAVVVSTVEGDPVMRAELDALAVETV